MDYTLKNECLEVRFTTKGGTLTSIKDGKGTEYLWQGDAKYWSGQAPVLFPICGSIRDDRAKTLDGKELAMPRHGIVRKEEFMMERITQDEIIFSIENTEKMLDQFPYPFRLYAKFRLEEDTVRMTYAVENTGDTRLPFFIGGHPGFRCPLDEGEDYSDYQIVFEKAEYCTIPTPVTETGLIDMEHRTCILKREKCLGLEHSLFHKDAVILDELESRKVRFCHKEKDKGIELAFEQFPYLILWSTANDGPFVAMEPWSGLSTCSDEDDVLEHKRNVSFAEPGETKEFTYTISIL